MARPDPSLHAHPTDRLVGISSPIQALRAQIRHLATFDTVGNALVPTLLLQGETGTGKGLLARVIHDSGPRAHGPFIDVNCAAIPETLLEVELFGFEAGTFTDAKRAKAGLMESASQGTLFLDEIDALPLSLQAKLLSALEEKRVRRLGAVESRQLDVKLIAATPTDLSMRVTEGRFRADLYHRLAVVVLEIPPVRERGSDILVLAQHFLRQYAAGHGLLPKHLTQDAEAWLLGYSWPGNVRELSHLMERGTLLRTESSLSAAILGELCLLRPQPVDREGAPPNRGKAGPMDEEAQIRRALGQTGGNVVRAAHLLGISRGALRYRMRLYGIGRPPLLLSSPIPIFSHQGSRDVSKQPQGKGGEAEVWEQKPVAVLAIDVAWPDSVVLHALPAEPWIVARRWQEAVAEQVQGFGGLLLQRSPLPLTAVFGLPQTLEQLPQRAVQVALAIRQQMGEDMAPDGKQVGPAMRMAVHLGQVLIDVQARDPTTRLLPLGETLSLPVRLLGHAVPGDILLSPPVRRRVEGWFDLQEREETLGAGLFDGVGACAVIGVKPRRSPLQVYGIRPLSPFIGRDRELAILHDLLGQADKGHGQVVGLVGEPGVGKSRLCYEMAQLRRPHGWLILESSPTAYGKETPYLPVIDLLKAYFQLGVRNEGLTIRDKVSAKLHTLGEALEPTLPALLTLLDVPVEDMHWQALEPPQRRQRILEACKRLWLRASQVQPLLLIVENLHWVDTESQAVLDSLVESLPAARLLLVVNYRPEYQHHWGSKTYYTQLRLGPLAPEHAEEFLRVLLGKDASLAPLKQLLIDRTESNPFFLEESVRTLVETQALVGEPGAYHPGHPLPTMQVPATVEAMLATRIDRLPPTAKRLLQTAAVIGMDVPLPLLQAVAELPEDALSRGLAHLQALEFLYETRLFPDHAYTFTHALTQQVAYGTLLQERRRALHARIVEALEVLSPDRPAEEVERLAHHAIRGEVWDKAVTYSRQAGAKAAERSAPREAAVAFEQALAALQHLPDSRATCEQAIDLHFDLRNALHPLNEEGRILNHLRQAEPLAEALGDQRRLAHLAGYLSVCLRHQGHIDEALVSAQRALAIGTTLGDVGLQVTANSFLGELYLWVLNDYRQAVEAFRRNVELLHGALLRERFGTTNMQSVVARAQVARCLAELGAFADGRAYAEDALRLAETVDHPYSFVCTCDGVGHFFLRQGALSQAIHVFERALTRREAVNFPPIFRRCQVGLGAAYALSGRVTEALPLLERGLEVPQPPRNRSVASLFPVWLGEGYVLAGRLAEAMQLGQQALEVTRTQKQQGYQAYALRLLGDVAAHRTPPEVEEGERHYRQALALAKALGMRPLVAHCRLGLGTLYTRDDRREQARAELSTAIQLYRTMDMTFWLAQAEAARAPLRGRTD